MTGVSSGTASIAHISELPKQTVASSSGSSCGILLSQQQPQLVVLSSHENTSSRQQVSNEDNCLYSSVVQPSGAGGYSSQPSYTETDSGQNSEAGLCEPTSVDASDSGQVVLDVCGVNSHLQPAAASQLQQSLCTAAQSNSTPSVTGPTESQSASHSHVIEQLQKQLMRSSTKQTVNGCRVVVNDDKTSTDVSCKVEEGEVNGNELMQFLS